MPASVCQTEREEVCSVSVFRYRMWAQIPAFYTQWNSDSHATLTILQLPRIHTAPSGSHSSIMCILLSVYKYLYRLTLLSLQLSIAATDFVQHTTFLFASHTGSFTNFWLCSDLTFGCHIITASDNSFILMFPPLICSLSVSCVTCVICVVDTLFHRGNFAGICELIWYDFLFFASGWWVSQWHAVCEFWTFIFTLYRNCVNLRPLRRVERCTKQACVCFTHTKQINCC